MGFAPVTSLTVRVRPVYIITFKVPISKKTKQPERRIAGNTRNKTNSVSSVTAYLNGWDCSLVWIAASPKDGA